MALGADGGTGVPTWRVEDWAYLAEGNLHVVLRFAGTHPGWRGRVLRVRKRSLKAVVPLCVSVTFARTVMARLLGSEYVDGGRLVQLPVAFAAGLAELIALEPRRPARRRQECLGLDTSCADAVLMADLTQPARLTCSRARDDSALSAEPSAICVEIKPKSGLVPPAVGAGHQRCCRFCRHQSLKQAQGKVRRQSQYCPVALFAARQSCALRVSQSVRGLLATPQNNFRVFQVDGQLLYGEDKPSPVKSASCHGAITPCPNISAIEAEGTRPRPKRACLGASGWPQCAALEWHQRSAWLDSVLQPFSSATHGGRDAFVQLLTGLIISERRLLDRLYQVQSMDPGIHRLVQLVEECSTGTGVAGVVADQCPPAVRQLLLDFALATTAKDVSIMITLQTVSPQMGHWIQERLPAHDERGSRLLVHPASRLQYLDLAMAPVRLRGGVRDGKLAGSLTYRITVCDLDQKVGGRVHPCIVARIAQQVGHYALRPVQMLLFFNPGIACRVRPRTCHIMPASTMLSTTVLLMAQARVLRRA